MCVCVTESFCSMPETNIILQINYSSMFLKIDKEKNSSKSLLPGRNKCKNVFGDLYPKSEMDSITQR